MRFALLNGSLLAATAFLLLHPAAGQAQLRIRDGVYYYPPSTDRSVQDNYYLPPSTKMLVDNPHPPYFPPSYYDIPTYFNRPTYMTSINYPWLYGGHLYTAGGLRSGLLDALPADYKYTRSAFNSVSPLPSSSSLNSISGVNGFSTLKSSAPALRTTIDVYVPSAADVWFQGKLMTQSGQVRRYYSPPLSPDVDYTYQIQATWREYDRPVTVTRTLRVRGGEKLELDMTAPEESSRSSTSTLRASELPAPSK